MAPPVPIEDIGEIDAVLLSHQQHYDNLDKTSREYLPKWGTVLTTPESAAALGGNARALATWETVELEKDGKKIRVTGAPAKHGLSDEIRKATGETMGFVLEWEGQETGALYESGDTVWFDELAEVGDRFIIGTAILHMGAAQIPAAGPNNLTMNAEDGIKVTMALKPNAVFPAHFEGWKHYTQGGKAIREEFDAAGVGDRLNILNPGDEVEITI